MGGLLAKHGKRRVFILGAGFNAPLGMPLTADLLREVHAVAAGKPWQRNGRPAAHGMADWLLEMLDWYYPLAHIDHAAIESGATRDGVNLEEFLSFVGAASAMERKGGDGDGAHARFSACLKSWLGEALERRQRETTQDIPEYYLRFAASLEDAVVLTFNWDTLLETLLQRQGIGFAFELATALEQNLVPLVKLHGSVDWFSMEAARGASRAALRLTPLGGAYDGIGRAQGDLLRAYESMPTPWLVVPSYDKVFQVISLGQVWQLPWTWLEDDLEVVIVGYGIRPDDYHSRALIYPRLVRGSRSGRLRVKVIDTAHSREEREDVERRFAGIEGCRFCFDGFSAEAIDFIEQA
jgi:hypothetical protein